MSADTVRRLIFCLGCGKTAAGEVPAPGTPGGSGTTADGTPVPGWCEAEPCQAARARHRATVTRILRENPPAR